jgi:hypothetical protein
MRRNVNYSGFTDLLDSDYRHRTPSEHDVPGGAAAADSAPSATDETSTMNKVEQYNHLE